MKCRMEENSRLFDVLCALQKGYESGDFSQLFPFLAHDCVLESQWVLEPNTGYDAVVSYFTGKGKTLAKHECFPTCKIVELLGDCNPINSTAVSINGLEAKPASFGHMYTPGKLCLLMEQTLNGETNGIIVDVQIDSEGMVKRIDLCMPELFRYRDFYTFVVFFPAQDDDENKEALVRVSEAYYGELHLFLACAGEKFDVYNDLHIPMENWRAALSYWRAFSEADSFDEAFEYIAGVDYEKGTVARPDVAKELGHNGKWMWADRKESGLMAKSLLEWTELYQSSHNYMNSCGW